jgi:hypothetical protein
MSISLFILKVVLFRQTGGRESGRGSLRAAEMQLFGY